MEIMYTKMRSLLSKERCQEINIRTRKKIQKEKKTPALKLGIINL